MTTSLATTGRTVAAPSPEAPPTAEPSPAAALAFVWGVWLIMTLMALRFAWRYGSVVPYLEEWLYVPCALGAEPFSLSWLWEQYLDTRYPLHKLVCYLSFSAFGLDERPIILMDIGLLSLLAAALIVAVRRVRGRTVLADAFFPIAMLHLGYTVVFNWAAINSYVMSSFLEGVVLLILFTGRGRFTVATAAVTGVCLLLLPLIHAFGLIYATALAVGLGSIALVTCRSPDPAARRAGRVLVAFAVLTILVVAIYFVGYTSSRLRRGEGEATPGTVVKGSLGFLATPFGVGSRPPFDRPMKRVMLGFVAIAIACIVARLFGRRAGERRPAAVLGLFLATGLAVALALAYGRAAWGPYASSAPRYGTSALPTLLCLYLVWEACGPAVLRPFGRAALCLSVLAFLIPNWARGYEVVRDHRVDQEAFLADVRAGVPIPLLIGRYAEQLYYRQDVLERCLRLLRDRRYGPFASIPSDPPFREVRLDGPPSAVLGASWDGVMGRSTSDKPKIYFDLPGPTPIAGIRLKYGSTNPGGWVPYLRVEFRAVDSKGAKQGFSVVDFFLKPDGQVREYRFWLDEDVDRIVIDPEIRPCDFTLSDIVLLVPERPPDRRGVEYHRRALE